MRGVSTKARVKKHLHVPKSISIVFCYRKSLPLVTQNEWCYSDTERRIVNSDICGGEADCQDGEDEPVFDGLTHPWSTLGSSVPLCLCTMQVSQTKMSGCTARLTTSYCAPSRSEQIPNMQNRLEHHLVSAKLRCTLPKCMLVQNYTVNLDLHVPCQPQK